jgi:hypothetical protein
MLGVHYDHHRFCGVRGLQSWKYSSIKWGRVNMSQILQFLSFLC